MRVFISDNKYVLNGSDKYNPSWLIPYDVINNDAFIVDGEKGGWISLKMIKIFLRTAFQFFLKLHPMD